MAIRGLRGATTVKTNAQEDILKGTKELLGVLFENNDITVEDIASIFFSVTKDLDAVFPAKAAREMGLVHTPMLCLNEINVSDSVNFCIRILLHVNSEKKQSDFKPIYLNDAIKLRPEFASK
ncbi:chorismate mutase [Candidatus Marinamargulisbacteria bacterium SCGC AAA071-K20]|nr:chorismate mutase [Candidatus Marinamargulisbacteria bacterium SCGC AAA071-K20]